MAPRPGASWRPLAASGWAPVRTAPRAHPELQALAALREAEPGKGRGGRGGGAGPARTRVQPAPSGYHRRRGGSSRPATRWRSSPTATSSARGSSTTPPSELARIKGLQSAEVLRRMPEASEEAVHRDYFVLDVSPARLSLAGDRAGTVGAARGPRRARCRASVEREGDHVVLADQHRHLDQLDVGVASLQRGPGCRRIWRRCHGARRPPAEARLRDRSIRRPPVPRPLAPPSRAPWPGPVRCERADPYSYDERQRTAVRRIRSSPVGGRELPSREQVAAEWEPTAEEVRMAGQRAEDVVAPQGVRPRPGGSASRIRAMSSGHSASGRGSMRRAVT